MIHQKELGRRLRAVRESCGFTQNDVAKRLELSRSAITQIELGKRKISSRELEKIGPFFGRSISDFFGESFHEKDVLATLFHAQAGSLDGEEVRESLRHHLALGRELVALERALGISRHPGMIAIYPTPIPQSYREATEQGIFVAEEERRRLGLGIQPLGPVAELLEAQGIITVQVGLPKDISGLTLHDPTVGPLVVINQTLPSPHRRFSYVHEYAHVLFDRERLSSISHSSSRNELMEIRANAFAMNFLLPERGVIEFIASLGKSSPRHKDTRLYDEEQAIQVSTKSRRYSESIQIYDVIHLAHGYRVSRQTAIYRLYNLKLLTEKELDDLLEMEKTGHIDEIAHLLQIHETDELISHNDFKHRFVGLALEAYRREEITYAKLSELATLISLPIKQLDLLVDGLGLAEKDPADLVLPLI